MMYNWDVKIPGKEKKNYYCKEHKFSLMFTGLFILFIEAITTTFPLVTLLPTLPSTTGSTPGIARNFTHRSELYASLGTLRIATLLFHRPLLYARSMRRVTGDA